MRPGSPVPSAGDDLASLDPSARPGPAHRQGPGQRRRAATPPAVETIYPTRAQDHQHPRPGQQLTGPSDQQGGQLLTAAEPLRIDPDGRQRRASAALWGSEHIVWPDASCTSTSTTTTGTRPRRSRRGPVPDRAPERQRPGGRPRPGPYGRCSLSCSRTVSRCGNGRGDGEMRVGCLSGHRGRAGDLPVPAREGGVCARR